MHASTGGTCNEHIPWSPEVWHPKLSDQKPAVEPILSPSEHLRKGDAACPSPCVTRLAGIEGELPCLTLETAPVAMATRDLCGRRWKQTWSYPQQRWCCIPGEEKRWRYTAFTAPGSSGHYIIKQMVGIMVGRAAQRQEWKKLCEWDLQLFITYYTLNKHGTLNWFFFFFLIARNSTGISSAGRIKDVLYFVCMSLRCDCQ